MCSFRQPNVFCQWHSCVTSVVRKRKWPSNRVFSHDVTAAILVSQNNETAAMLVSQSSPVGVERFSYANAFFCSTKFACMLTTWVKTLHYRVKYDGIRQLPLRPWRFQIVGQAKCNTSGCYRRKKKEIYSPIFAATLISHHATTWLHVRFDSKMLKRAPSLFRSLCSIVLQNKLQFLVAQFMVTLLRLSASRGKALNCGLIRWLLSQDLCNAIFRYVMAEEKALPSQEVINLGKTIH